MGIQGLLPMLQKISRPDNISSFSDAYVWLHRGAHPNALEILLDTRQPPAHIPSYVRYCMKQIGLLRRHGVIPILVFDGANLPSKACTEEARAGRRRESRSRIDTLLVSGDRVGAQAVARQCVDITPKHAYTLIQHLKVQGVEYVVSPYEADAQLAYLQRIGFVEAIVTEDSDLLVYGCERVIYKLQCGSGECVVISSSDIGSLRMFRGWGREKFRHMCILAGCDYLPGLRGIGLKKAHAALSKTAHWTAAQLLQSWQKFGQLVHAPPIPHDYMSNFERADLTFKHQRVYDPVTKTLEYCTPLPPSADGVGVVDAGCLFVGAVMDDCLARGIGEGVIDPISKLAFGGVVGKENMVAGYHVKADQYPVPMTTRRVMGRSPGITTITNGLDGQPKSVPIVPMTTRRVMGRSPGITTITNGLDGQLKPVTIINRLNGLQHQKQQQSTSQKTTTITSPYFPVLLQPPSNKTTTTKITKPKTISHAYNTTLETLKRTAEQAGMSVESRRQLSPILLNFVGRKGGVCGSASFVDDDIICIDDEDIICIDDEDVRDTSVNTKINKKFKNNNNNNTSDVILMKRDSGTFLEEEEEEEGDAECTFEELEDGRLCQVTNNARKVKK